MEVIRQNYEIRNMRCHSGNARFCKNCFKILQKEMLLCVV